MPVPLFRRACAAVFRFDLFSFSTYQRFRSLRCGRCCFRFAFHALSSLSSAVAYALMLRAAFDAIRRLPSRRLLPFATRHAC